MSKREKTKEEKQYSIKPVESIPPSLRKVSGIYNDILNEIMDNKTNEIFAVSIKNMDWKSIYSLLDIKIRNRKLPLKLFVRENKLFIKKYGSYEEVDKLRKKWSEEAKERVRKKHKEKLEPEKSK